MKDFDPSFTFDFGEEPQEAPWEFTGAIKKARESAGRGVSVDERIKRKVQERRANRGAKEEEEDASSLDGSGSDGGDDDDSEDDDELERAREEGRAYMPRGKATGGDKAKPGDHKGAKGTKAGRGAQKAGSAASSGKQAEKRGAAAASGARAAVRGPPDDSDASESESNSDEGGDGARGDPLSEDGGGDHAAESDGEGESDGGDSDGDDDEEDEEEDDDSDDEEEMGAERRASHGAAGTAGQGRQAARDKKGGFFARTPDGTKFTAKSFADLGLSRPLVKACAVLGYTSPTPIQAACIPLAMSGRDICGSAMTGSGKTAAFALPVLERLLHRDRRHSSTYLLVLTPTRELAVQIHSMVSKLAQFTDVRCALVVGGLSLREQEAAMRTRPETVVATPGRIVDLLMNSQSVDLDDLAVLVLDEADRLLEMGFLDEVKEIVRLCPRKRQTLLFSATMTEQVERLAAVSLHSPVRLAADQANRAPRDLTQEIVRLKGSQGASKEAALLALCGRSLSGGRTIVFCGTKRQAHRTKVLFGLLGLPAAAELHGNMTQAERLESLEKFRRGDAKFLLCTDVAARGLDILGVETVVNYEAPRTLATYLHRIGRTARAGRNGRAVTFVGDADRTLLKQIVKSQQGVPLKTRVIPGAAIAAMEKRLEGVAEEVQDIFAEEREEASMRRAEMEISWADNLLTHEQEIKARPKREWFRTTRDKAAKKKVMKAESEGLLIPESEDKGAGRTKADKYEAKAEMKRKRAAEKAAEEAGGVKRRKLSESEKEMEASAKSARGFKSAARKLLEQGVNPRAAAKLAARMRGGEAAGGKKKKAATTKGLFGDERAAGVSRPAKVYAGGGRSQEVRAPKTGLSDREKKVIARHGKGKAQFKSKARYKRK